MLVLVYLDHGESSTAPCRPYCVYWPPTFSPQSWCFDRWNMGCNAIHGWQVSLAFFGVSRRANYVSANRGYLDSCHDIVTCARNIADTITSSVPELYVLGSPPASVVAFGSKHPKVNILEVGDMMSKKGWHLNGLSGPPALHIACTVRSNSFQPKLWYKSWLGV